jgi:hypothetical protein
MHVRVIIYGTMLRTEGQPDFGKDIAEGTTVRELILALGYQPHHVASILATVNGAQASHHRRLLDGDEVVLSVMVGGG